MYRLILYVLIFLVGSASVLGFFNLIPFSPISIISSASFLTAVCFIANKHFSWIFKAPTNLESVYITALIISLIVSPATSLNGFLMLSVVGVIATGSKYILAINKKHIFNPTAIAVVITGLLGFVSASWWVGSLAMSPFVLIGGLLLVRKLRFKLLVGTFLLIYLVFTLGLSILSGIEGVTLSTQVILNSHLLFFAFIMLTEPLTLPPTRNLRIIYAVLIAILSVPQIHLGNIYLIPEQALIIGNIFSFIVGFKKRMILEVSDKNKISKDVIEFIFKPTGKLNYKAGQYLEWTFPHNHPDSRGTRRFFTIASSPTEKNIRLGVKFVGDKASSFKKSFEKISGNKKIVATSLGGDFVLPDDVNKKLVFIAGGIGITPYRSMIKYLIDKKEKRNIVLLCSNSDESEIVYKDIFDQAEKELGIKVIYTLSGESVRKDWSGLKGRIDEKMIKQEIPDYKEREFFVSGSQPLTNGVKEILKKIGIKSSAIKTDYFPGLT